MLATINPYGLGNVYQKSNVGNTNALEGEQVESKQSKEIQELPNVSQTTLEIRKFSDGIKGANEMVGAMQIADITLNALSNQIKSNGIDVVGLDTTAKAAQFKGESLFGKELRISLAGEDVALSLPLPSQVSGDLGEAFANKHQEITEKMGQISSLIEKASLPFHAPSGQDFDFENFSTETLKGLFS